MCFLQVYSGSMGSLQVLEIHVKEEAMQNAQFREFDFVMHAKSFACLSCRAGATNAGT